MRKTLHLRLLIAVNETFRNLFAKPLKIIVDAKLSPHSARLFHFHILTKDLNLQYLITLEAEDEKKGFTQKWMRPKGFSAWGIQTGPFAAC